MSKSTHLHSVFKYFLKPTRGKMNSSIKNFFKWIEHLEGKKIITLSSTGKDLKHRTFESAIDGDKWENQKIVAKILLSTKYCGIIVRHFLETTYNECIEGEERTFPCKNIFVFYKETGKEFIGFTEKETRKNCETCAETGKKLPSEKGVTYINTTKMKFI